MKKDKTLANNPTMDDDYLFSASATDCTGLIPSVAHDDFEVDNYEELYPYLPPTAPPLTNPVPLIGVPPTVPLPEVGLPPTISEVGDTSTTTEVGNLGI